MICLGSFKWSHLFLNEEKNTRLLQIHPHTQDGFIHVVGGLVYDDQGRIYLHHNALYNEFLLPWGKVEFWETYEQALTRELKEELDIEVHKMNYLSSVKYIAGGVRRCFHMFEIQDYSGIPINNEHEKLDYYWSKKIESDNGLWFAVSIDGTITDDSQDIMHSFIDLYHIEYVTKHVDPQELLWATYTYYDSSQITVSDHYYLYYDPNKQQYEYKI